MAKLVVHPTYGRAVVPDADEATWNARGFVTQTSVTDPSGVPSLGLAGLVDAKGDLVVGTADNMVARLAVGAAGTVLAPDASTPSGLAYQSTISLAGSLTATAIYDGGNRVYSAANPGSSGTKNAASRTFARMTFR